MTSEVLMLNKDAVVIAADSAVTTGRDPHPRYSKAANKIFDLSIHGNVAVTIFASAEIDRVPWELALKQFRAHDSANPQHSRLEDYAPALVKFLENHSSLFPLAHREGLLERRFFQAAGFVLNEISAAFPDFADLSKTPGDRTAAWQQGTASVGTELHSRVFQTPLTATDHQAILSQAHKFQPELLKQVSASPEYSYADPVDLSNLAIETLVKRPMDVLGYTGLVFAGYGADEIFPSFVHIEIYGHIDGTLMWKEVNRYTITHDNDALIQPFAQSAMIDRFTDGFDSTLSSILYRSGLTAFNVLVSDLSTAGFSVPPAVSAPLIYKRHQEFMSDWKKKNWEANFHPLRRVLNSLSVPEMGHLAESLLVLEELHERVTSPSESVGGPIDVVVVTKAEGLVWLKRKHFFDPVLNPRYAHRAKLKYT